MTETEVPQQPKAEGDMDFLSQRSEIFRSKLITDFHLLESIGEKKGGRLEVPAFYTHDILEHESMNTMMNKRPNGLVRFQVYHDKEQRIITVEDRRTNRIKTRNSKYPPLDLWAHWVVTSSWFQNTILALILLNSVVLAIQAELSDRKGAEVEFTKLALDIFDYCTLCIFVLEIFMKWLDNFWDFWKNRWNIFDFAVTFSSFIPEIITLFISEDADSNSTTMQGLAVVANNMRTFRVLRSLKMVSRFQKVRLIVLAVTKAFQAMVFIGVLLIVFFYIFAIIGVIFFNPDKLVLLNITSLSDSAKEKEQMIINYSNSFSYLWPAFITLFQLLTLDHWLDVYTYMTRVNDGFSHLYLFLWILIGSFIFRNIFVGIMVNNFQGIRNDLFQEVEVIKDRERRDIAMLEFAEELDKQAMDKPLMSNEEGEDGGKEEEEGTTESRDRLPGLPTRKPSQYKSTHELKEALSQQLNKADREGMEWSSVVERNLENLAREEATFCWPRDSMFRYFLMMEAMQENLQERAELLNLARDAIIQTDDN